MKSLRVTVFLLFVMLAAHPAADAQDYVPTPVEISTKLITIDDKTYYEHLVLERQTLYSICKAYGAEIEEVTNLNLSRVANGLKAGTILFIPYKDTDSTAAASHPGTAERQTAEKAGQPAREPAVTGEGQNSGQNPESANQSASDDGQFIRHRVKWYDSLLMLSLKYKVSQADIMAINNLESKTLVVGQYLKIPVGGNYVADSDNSIIDTAEDDLEGEGNAVADNVSIIAAVQNEQQEEAAETQFLVPFSGTAHVALILPIAASSTPSDNFLDFYAGVLMALNEIKGAGINVNLKVIDMADFESFDDLATASSLDSFDFIIGHFSTDIVDIAADYCDKHRIPLFSPMDQKIERATYRHPYLVDVPLSAATQAMRLVESIRYDASSDNVIVLCENSEEQGQFHKDIISSLEYLHIPYSIARSGIGRSGSANVNGLLDSSKHNHIIITSEKESLASDAVRNTGLLARGNRHKITGYISGKVRRFESIEQESFQSMNAHCSLGYFVDYKDEEVRNYVRRYRALYNSEPSPYAFQGYDIAMYGVNALAKYGSFMINGISTYPYSGLQLNFRFDRRTPGGGMFNEGARNIIYDDSGIMLTR